MPIQLSPSVVVQERDLTNVIPAVSASIGATIVDAGWGPVMEVTTIDSENALVATFGKPNSSNATSWFSAANFLAYSKNLLVARTKTGTQKNAVADNTLAVDRVTVNVPGSGYTVAATVTFSDPGNAVTDPNGNSAGMTATGTIVLNGTGGIDSITITNPGSGYGQAPIISISTGGGGGSGANLTAVLTSGSGVAIDNLAHYTSDFEGNAVANLSLYGPFAAKYPGSLGNSLKISIADSASFSTWTYKSAFTSAPGTSTFAVNNLSATADDEMHMVVVDVNGFWSGQAGTILETFEFVSKAADGRKEDGTSSYYKTVLNNNSKYMWWLAHVDLSAVSGNTNKALWGTTLIDKANVTFRSIGSNSLNFTLSGGTDDYASTNSNKMDAFDLFKSDEEFDLSLLIVGKADTTLASHVVQNVAEVRKDCVAFVSPQQTDGDPIIGNTSTQATEITTYRNSLPSSSYMVVDSGYKYQYDRYNDTYRWIPLNGDVAGLCARTDETNDPWFSPAGLNRGQIKNVVRLAYNPRKTDRDTLYVAGVNPVVSFPGQGVVLYGDKTGLKKPSAFDRINVRRLFIVLEKAIATAAKYQLFEFNDGFTRAQFRNMVEPFLRDVKGRRGVTDFRVVCDESNNTAEVIDTNRFVADIYIKPARSINFIQLNFVATRTGAEFSEIAG